MATHKQAAKRNRQRLVRQSHHRHYRSTMRTYIKRVRQAVEEKDVIEAKEALTAAIPMIDRCAQKGVVPKKRAARIVSRLTKAVQTVA